MRLLKRLRTLLHMGPGRTFVRWSRGVPGGSPLTGLSPEFPGGQQAEPTCRRSIFRWASTFGLGVCILLVIACGGRGATSTPLPTETPTTTPTLTPRPTATVPRPTPTATPRPTPTRIVVLATPTPVPTSTPTPRPTATPTPVPQIRQTRELSLQIFSPADNSLLSSKVARLTGIASPDATVSFNGQIVTIEITGEFEGRLLLEDGPNLDLFVKTPRQPGARWG